MAVKTEGQFIYDVEEMFRGMSTSKFSKDGGFSPETTGINLIAEKGVIHASGPITDKSTNLEDVIIASCEDPTYLGEDRMFLDETGNFYYWTGTTLTKKATTSSDIVTVVTTDFIPFYTTSDGVMYYATTSAGANGEIIRWDGNTTLLEDWWTNASHLNQQDSLSGFTPQRPLIVFEKHLYVGDKDKLHRIDESKTVSNGILTLQNTQTITALGKDPGSGKMLVATNTGANASATGEGESKILIYDGFSNKALRVVPVNGLVTAFKNVGGTVYVFYQNKVGIWTGTGIRFLREFENITLSSSLLAYKHHVTSIENTLYVVDGTRILAYGPVRQGGGNIWYTALTADANITMLTAIGNNKLGYSHATDKFYTFDVTSKASVITGGVSIYFNQEKLPREVEIVSVILEYSSALPTTAENLHTVQLIYTNPTNRKSQTDTLRTIGNTAGESEVEIGNLGITAKTLQLKLTIAPETLTNVAGITRIIINYNSKK